MFSQKAHFNKHPLVVVVFGDGDGGGGGGGGGDGGSDGDGGGVCVCVSIYQALIPNTGSCKMKLCQMAKFHQLTAAIQCITTYLQQSDTHQRISIILRTSVLLKTVYR